MNIPIPSNPLDDFKKQEESMFRQIQEARQQELEIRKREDETIGVHALNNKLLELIEVSIVSAQESSKAASENIKLQKDIVKLTEKLRCLTIWIMILTILMAVLAPIAAYSSGKLLFNDAKQYINAKQIERDAKRGNYNADANKAIESPKESTKTP